MAQPPAPSRQPARSSQSYRPPADPVLQQRAWAATAMSMIGLLGMADSGANIRRGVYVIAIGVVIAAAALWLSATSMTRARRVGSTRPRGAVLATVLGAIGVGLGAMVLAGCALFWPQLTRYSQCESGAGTLTAQQACFQQMQGSVTGAIDTIKH